jgi:hypothetical protein
MTRQPIPPFSRADAVYFLASAGAFLGAAGAADARYSAGSVCEALATLGVSDAELRVATTRGLLGQGSRWDDILSPEFMDALGKEPRNDHAGN